MYVRVKFDRPLQMTGRVEFYAHQGGGMVNIGERPVSSTPFKLGLKSPKSHDPLTGSPWSSAVHVVSCPWVLYTACEAHRNTQAVRRRSMAGGVHSVSNCS